MSRESAHHSPPSVCRCSGTRRPTASARRSPGRRSCSGRSGRAGSTSCLPGRRRRWATRRWPGRPAGRAPVSPAASSKGQGQDSGRTDPCLPCSIAHGSCLFVPCPLRSVDVSAIITQRRRCPVSPYPAALPASRRGNSSRNGRCLWSGASDCPPRRERRCSSSAAATSLHRPRGARLQRRLAPDPGVTAVRSRTVECCRCPPCVLGLLARESAGRRHSHAPPTPATPSRRHPVASLATPRPGTCASSSDSE